MPALIAIDWGTTSARAYRLDARGRIIDERSAPLGVQKIAPDGFPAALRALLGDAAAGRVPMIACGMIGSRQGWIEAPYRDCPADFTAIASALTPVPGTALSIVPGLMCRDAAAVPDVMRGEETQILGALDERRTAGGARRVVVLPGTHSKWALVGAAGIETFATFMTGELYAVLLEHSILGRLAAEGEDTAARAARGEPAGEVRGGRASASRRWRPTRDASHSGNRLKEAAALERGVQRSLDLNASLTHDLFSARTLALVAELAPGAVGDYLSGLLLGAEVAAGRRWLERHAVAGTAVTLIGEAALCERYTRSLALAGLDATLGPGDAAARGLWRIATDAGMVPA